MKLHRARKTALSAVLFARRKFFSPQASGKQGVDADAGSCRHCDHQILRREGKRNGGQRIFTDLCDEHAVHHVVERLDQHGNDQGIDMVKRSRPTGMTPILFSFLVSICSFIDVCTSYMSI